MKHPVFDTHLSLALYHISSQKIQECIRLALITDLHSCYYGEDQRELLNLVEQVHPQAVLLGGDIFDHVIPHTNAHLTLEYLSKQYPCFYVSGNHEYRSREITQLKQAIRRYRIRILEGDYTELQTGNNTIGICGVDDPFCFGKKETFAQIEQAYKLSSKTSHFGSYNNGHFIHCI